MDRRWKHFVVFALLMLSCASIVPDPSKKKGAGLVWEAMEVAATDGN